MLIVKTFSTFRKAKKYREKKLLVIMAMFALENILSYSIFLVLLTHLIKI